MSEPTPKHFLAARSPLTTIELTGWLAGSYQKDNKPLLITLFFAPGQKFLPLFSTEEKFFAFTRAIGLTEAVYVRQVVDGCKFVEVTRKHDIRVITDPHEGPNGTIRFGEARCGDEDMSSLLQEVDCNA